MKVLKKTLWLRCFPVNFANFLRTLLTEQLQTSACLLSRKKNTPINLLYKMNDEHVQICKTLLSSHL